MNEFFADFTEESTAFDNSVYNAVTSVIDSICSYTEKFESTHLITESEKDTLITSIKKFFANLIATIKNFINEIKVETNRKRRNIDSDFQLHKLYKKLKEAKENGSTKVQVSDVWSIEKTYLEAVKEMKSIAINFSKMNYKRVSEIDDDLVKFNKIYDKWDVQLTKINDKKIIVDINKMINFVEDEISGRSKVTDSINDCMTLIEQMESDCSLIATKSEILGPDIIPKHVSFLRKISTSITLFIKKWIVKVISTVVLIIG